MRMRPTLGGLTLVLILLVGAGIYFADRHHKAAELERADAEAVRFSEELAGFRSDGHDELIDLDHSGDVAATVEAAHRLRTELPKPEVMGEYGRKASSAYRAVLDQRASVAERMDIVVEVLEEWAAAVPFATAVREALDTEVPQSVVAGPVSDGEAVRSELIPLMRQVKAQFEAVTVPAGQEQLAAGVSQALQYVIDQASAAAQQLDMGQDASFTYGDQYRDALRPVLEYEAQLRARVESAIAGIAPVVEPAPTEPGVPA